MIGFVGFFILAIIVVVSIGKLIYSIISYVPTPTQVKKLDRQMEYEVEMLLARNPEYQARKQRIAELEQKLYDRPYLMVIEGGKKK